MKALLATGVETIRSKGRFPKAFGKVQANGTGCEVSDTEVAERGRVAIVDDDEGVRATMAAVFRHEGLEASTFRNVEDTLLAMRSIEFTVFVIDWQLELGTSERLMRKVIDHIEDCDRSCALAPVLVLLSGNLHAYSGSFADEVTDLMARGKLNYREKPYSTIKLCREVRELANLNVARAGKR